VRPQAARVAPVLAGLALALLAGPSTAQKKRPDDPASCSWCRNDPALLAAAGLVSHGPFEFGKYDTQVTSGQLPSADIRWLETEHFKIGFALGPHKVKLEEKKKIIAELTRLKEKLPDLKPETGILDPWMRLHLYAQRCEDTWDRFCDLMRISGKKWADGTGVWHNQYMGEGPYLGQKLKYEVLVLPNQTLHVQFLQDHTGLRVKNSQRWHYIDKGSIAVICHAEQGQLRQDAALHGHLAFSLAHNLLDGLNHYNYDTPIWIHEGLAHWMEREIDPNYNSFNSGEGAVAETTSKSNWKPEVLKLISSGEAPRMASLMQLKSYAELKLEHHFTTWSMIDFLLATRPEEFAKLIWAVKNCKDERGVPTGANLPDWHRDKFKELLGWNYAEFDEAWAAWAKEAYRPGPPKGGDSVNPLPGRGIGGS